VSSGTLTTQRTAARCGDPANLSEGTFFLRDQYGRSPEGITVRPQRNLPIVTNPSSANTSNFAKAQNTGRAESVMILFHQRSEAEGLLNSSCFRGQFSFFLHDRSTCDRLPGCTASTLVNRQRVVVALNEEGKKNLLGRQPFILPRNRTPPRVSPHHHHSFA